MGVPVNTVGTVTNLVGVSNGLLGTRNILNGQTGLIGNVGTVFNPGYGMTNTNIVSGIPTGVLDAGSNVLGPANGIVGNMNINNGHGVSGDVIENLNGAVGFANNVAGNIVGNVVGTAVGTAGNVLGGVTYTAAGLA